MPEPKKTQKPWVEKQSYTWTLPEPLIDSSGGKHDTITLRQPSIGLLKDAQTKGTINGKEDNVLIGIELIAGMTGKSYDLVKQIPISHFEEFQEYLMHFIGAGHPI